MPINSDTIEDGQNKISHCFLGFFIKKFIVYSLNINSKASTAWYNSKHAICIAWHSIYQDVIFTFYNETSSGLAECYINIKFIYHLGAFIFNKIIMKHSLQVVQKVSQKVL